jgi:stage V sporulation protein B
MSLIFNLFLTNFCGSEIMGTTALTMSFFSLMSIIAGGNIFLCSCIFLSKESGRTNGNPRSVTTVIFKSGLLFSFTISVLIFLFSKNLSQLFFGVETFSTTVKYISFIILFSTLYHGMNGCLFSKNKVIICTVSDIIRFVIQSFALLFFILQSTDSADKENISFYIILSNFIGLSASILFLMPFFIKFIKSLSYYKKEKTSIISYSKIAMPLVIGSIVKAILASSNDALIPYTLRQSGSSYEYAMSQLGIFEGIVIPTIFFPSFVLCAMSQILLPEIPKLISCGNLKKSNALINRSIHYALLFSFLISAIFLILGKDIGLTLSSKTNAHIYIKLLAPVIPFIYLEIIFESILKSIEKQTFSTINYIAEYTIRIAFILILIPFIGFKGIIISYYASNIAGNTARFIKIYQSTKFCKNIIKFIFTPLFSVVLGIFVSLVFYNVLINCTNSYILSDIIFIFLAIMICSVTHKLLHFQVD